MIDPAPVFWTHHADLAIEKAMVKDPPIAASQAMLMPPRAACAKAGIVNGWIALRHSAPCHTMEILPNLLLTILEDISAMSSPGQMLRFSIQSRQMTSFC